MGKTAWAHVDTEMCIEWMEKAELKCVATNRLDAAALWRDARLELVRLREVEKFAVNVVKLLKTAERSGNEKDEPEGSRVIMISDTLANELVEAYEKSKSQDKGE